MPEPAPRSAALRVLAVLLCAGSSATWAQSSPPFTNLARLALGQAILNSGRDSLNAQIAAAFTAWQNRTPPPASGEATSAQARLTYDPDPRLSDWTRASMIDTLSQQDAQVRRQMENAFAGNAVLEDFARFMAARGYSSHDVADDTAELLLVSWEIATDGTATDAQARGLHAQARALFLGTPELRGMTNADRQLMGERIAYQVIISSSARKAYERTGGVDPAQQAQLRQSAAAMLREQGIDLTRLHLTDRGFSR